MSHVGTAASAKPLPLELKHPEELRAGQAALSVLGKGKGKKGKGDWKGKSEGKKCESNKDEKDRQRQEGHGKGKSNAQAAKYFAGSCLLCKAWGHMKKHCCWNESAKNGKDTASLATLITPAANTTTGLPITGILIQSDKGEAVPADPSQWLYSVNREPSREVLIDSGAATSLCQQSLVDTLGGKPWTDCRDQSCEMDKCATEAASARSAALVERYSTSSLAIESSLNVLVVCIG